MFEVCLKYVSSMFEVCFSNVSRVFTCFHVFSRVFTCVFCRRAYPNAPAWRAKPSSLRRSARTLTMLTSPRMYSRANLSWTSVYVRAHATRRARSQLCGAIRHCYQIDGTFLGLCAESRPRRSWFHMAEVGEMRTKHTSNILQTCFKHASNILQNTCKHL